MTENANDFSTIDEYISTFAPKVRAVLKEIRKTIKAAAPLATEKISYRMPTFFQNGNLVHFAAFARHIGLYPAPSGISAFEEELRPYRSGKGSIQFPLDEAVPLDLISRIVKYRVAENDAKAKAKEEGKAKGSKKVG
jgi:uncharacterized protein YdhG (YjbR/CyaY superfamily)